MPRSKSDVDAALLQKGFLSGEGDHAFFIYHTVDGKKTRARTKTSHGKGFDIGDNLISQMAKQCHLTNAQFKDLVDCPMDRPALEIALVARGIIDPPPAPPVDTTKDGKKQ